MRSVVFVFSLLILAVGSSRAGSLRIEPAVVAPGETALLSWAGATKENGTVEFNGRSFPLLPDGQGGVALLGTDLETPPGDYPVRVRRSEAAAEGHLRVVAVVRKEERIRLPKVMVSPEDPVILQKIERERTLLRKVFAGRTPGAIPRRFLRPVADPLGSPFGLRRILNGEPRSPHAGVDFHSPRGTPVKASADGTVVYSGELYFSGLTVIIDHGEGLFTLYCHLSEVNCAVGRELAAQKILGRVGSSGRATGAHLHWGAKLRGDRIDPLALAVLINGKKP